MEKSIKIQKMKIQIRQQHKLIKKLKNMIRYYAPYMKFPEE